MHKIIKQIKENSKKVYIFLLHENQNHTEDYSGKPKENVRDEHILLKKKDVIMYN